MGAARMMVPKALAAAASASRDPKWVGQIVVALVCGGDERGLDMGQRTVLEMCREELLVKTNERAAAAERKRRERGKAR